MLPSLGQAGNRLAQAIAPLRRPCRQPRAPGPAPPPQPGSTGPTKRRAARVRGRDPVARRYLDLLGPLDWDALPRTPANRPWPGPAGRRAPYVAAYLVKLNEGLRSMGHLRRYLVNTPPWSGSSASPSALTRPPHGFDVERSLPSRRQLGLRRGNSTTPRPSSC